MRHFLLIIFVLFTFSGCVDDIKEEIKNDIIEIKNDIIENYDNYSDYQLMHRTLKFLAVKKQDVVLDDFKFKQAEIYKYMSDKGMVNNTAHLDYVEDQFRIMLITYSANLKKDIAYINNSLNVIGGEEITQDDLNSIYYEVRNKFSNFIDYTILPDYDFFDSQDIGVFHQNLYTILDDSNDLVFNDY